MQFKKILSIVPLLAAMLTGCVGEDLSDCDPKTNVELVFTYITESNAAFTDIISSVDVLIFDEDAFYYGHERAELPALKEFQGMKLALNPGKYYVIAWGNVAERSSFSELLPKQNQLSECYLEISPRETHTGDPIYYAPYKEKPSPINGQKPQTEPAIYELVVKEGESTVKTLDFVRAHRTINVWIKDAPDQIVYPSVKASALWSRYDFYFTPQEDRRDYLQEAKESTLSGVAYLKSTFYSAFGLIDDMTQINIVRASDNSVYQTVGLRKFVDDNNITNTDDIDILFVFEDTGITITVPQWKEKPTQPGTN